MWAGSEKIDNYFSENATSDYDYYGGGPDYGWCWLENLYDQREPSSYCFDDVYYSRRHGRFHSRKACNPDEEPLEKEYKFNLDEDLLCDGPPGSCEEPPVVFDEWYLYILKVPISIHIQLLLIYALYWLI